MDKLDNIGLLLLLVYAIVRGVRVITLNRHQNRAMCMILAVAVIGLCSRVVMQSLFIAGVGVDVVKNEWYETSNHITAVALSAFVIATSSLERQHVE